MPAVIANRYARALADLVAPKANYREVLEELRSFAAAYHASQELREVFDSPAVSVAQKRSVLDSLARRMGVSPLVLNFLRVLMTHYRMPLLDEAVAGFRNIAYARLGIVRVKVSSASGVSSEEQERLRARFNELTQKQSE